MPRACREVFTRSALARAALAVGVSFDREAVLEEARSRWASTGRGSKPACMRICAAPSAC